MPPTIFRHKGDFSPQTRENRALRFIEAYASNVASDLTLSYPDTKWYSPDCRFFDTTNVTYTGAAAIKTWMLKLFSPFDRVSVKGVSFQVVDESEGDDKFKATVHTEWMVGYYPKGDEVPLFAPRMFVFLVENSVTEDGYDGLQFIDVSLYWDTDLVKSEVKRRATTKE